MAEDSKELLNEETPEEEVEEEKVEKIAEKIIEGEEVEEETPEEYIPEEVEEPLPAGTLNIRAIEIMTEISDLLTKAVKGDEPVDEVTKEVTDLRKRLGRRTGSIRRKRESRKSKKGGKKVKHVRRS